jgi:MtaA/CmuA family methyltransferase
MNSKLRCLSAIQGRPVDRVPVFPLLMFFAADRLGVPYREFATNYQVLAEAQQKMLEDYDVDAITTCSDAFRVSADLGGEMVFPKDGTPYLARPLIETEQDLKRLHKPDCTAAKSRMQDRAMAARKLTQLVGDEVLVLGWVDMPFAEACSVCGVSQFMTMLVDQPVLAHRILEFLTGIVIDFATLQLDADVPMIGAGDAAASLISPRMYREFALPYEQRICEAVHARGGLVKLHICGNTSRLLADMAQSGADLFNVDHLVSLQAAKEIYEAAGKCFKGNLDPVADLLQSTAEECGRKARECMKTAQSSSYMLSAGCEIPAAVTNDVFRAFCQGPISYD